MTGRSRCAALVGGLALVVVAGCSGSGEVAAPTLTPLPSTTSSTVGGSVGASGSVSGSASVSPPVVRAGPPPQTPFTKEGAELFVRAYYATASRALVSGNTRDMRRYEDAACECLGLADWIDGLDAKGEHFQGAGYRIHTVEERDSAGNSAVVAATWSMRHMPLIANDGTKVDQSTAVRSQTDLLVLYYQGHGWKVGKIIAGKPR